MKSLVLAAALAAASFSGAALAQSESFYLQGNIGQSSIDLGCGDAAVVTTTSCKKSNVGFKVLGGYELGNGLAAEAYIANFGKAVGKGIYQGHALTENYKGTSFGLGIAYAYHFSPKFSSTLRGGLAVNRSELSSNVGGISGSLSKTKAAPYFGLGLAYHISSQLSVGIDADFTEFSYAGVKVNGHLISGFARYSF